MHGPLMFMIKDSAPARAQYYAETQCGEKQQEALGASFKEGQHKTRSNNFSVLSIITKLFCNIISLHPHYKPQSSVLKQCYSYFSHLSR